MNNQKFSELSKILTNESDNFMNEQKKTKKKNLK